MAAKRRVSMETVRRLVEATAAVVDDLLASSLKIRFEPVRLEPWVKQVAGRHPILGFYEVAVIVLTLLPYCYCFHSWRWTTRSLSC